VTGTKVELDPVVAVVVPDPLFAVGWPLPQPANTIAATVPVVSSNPRATVRRVIISVFASRRLPLAG
jgi:hypothetical protein